MVPVEVIKAARPAQAACAAEADLTARRRRVAAPATTRVPGYNAAPRPCHRSGPAVLITHPNDPLAQDPHAPDLPQVEPSQAPRIWDTARLILMRPPDLPDLRADLPHRRGLHVLIRGDETEPSPVRTGPRPGFLLVSPPTGGAMHTLTDAVLIICDHCHHRASHGTGPALWPTVHAAMQDLTGPGWNWVADLATQLCPTCAAARTCHRRGHDRQDCQSWGEDSDLLVRLCRRCHHDQVTQAGPRPT